VLPEKIGGGLIILRDAIRAIRSRRSAVSGARTTSMRSRSRSTSRRATPRHLVFGLTYGRPEPAIEAVVGAPAIKSATLSVTVDYKTDAPLS
jgi:hypothetical protein